MFIILFLETVPDVLIVEQKIDTITVDSDSDFDENENDQVAALLDQDIMENNEPSQTPIIVQVKTEPEDPYDNIDIVEHSVYPEESKDRFQDAIERLELEEDRISMSFICEDLTSQVGDSVMPLITNVTGAVDTIPTQDLSTANNEMEIHLGNLTEIYNTKQNPTRKNITELNKELQGVINYFDDNSKKSIVIDEDDDDINPIKDITKEGGNASTSEQIESVIDITSPKARCRKDSDRAEGLCENTNLYPTITAIASGSPVKAKMDINTDIENRENVDEGMSEVLQDSDDFVEDIIVMRPEKTTNLHLGNEIITDSNIADDGFEFGDDGIEYHEEQNDLSDLNGKKYLKYICTKTTPFMTITIKSDRKY